MLLVPTMRASAIVEYGRLIVLWGRLRASEVSRP
jgi:hypothetical protein